LKLSFKGFAARYDSWMGMDSELLTPMGSFREAKALVLRKRSKEKKARKLKEAVEAFEAEEAAQVAKEADAADTTDKVISRSGRVSCTKKKSAPAPKRKKVCKVEEVRGGEERSNEPKTQFLAPLACQPDISVFKLRLILLSTYSKTLHLRSPIAGPRGEPVVDLRGLQGGRVRCQPRRPFAHLRGFVPAHFPQPLRWAQGHS
jgi:hypothetical protein